MVANEQQLDQTHDPDGAQEEPKPPEYSSAPSGASAAQGDFQVGEWHGMPNYKCPECDFTTVSSPGHDGNEEIGWHLATSHAGATRSSDRSTQEA